MPQQETSEFVISNISKINEPREIKFARIRRSLFPRRENVFGRHIVFEGPLTFEDFERIENLNIILNNYQPPVILNYNPVIHGGPVLSVD